MAEQELKGQERMASLRSGDDATPPFDLEECNERRIEFVMNAHLCGHDELYPEIKHMVQNTNIGFINHMKNCLNCLPIYRASEDKIKPLKHSNTYENPKIVVEILSLICRKLENPN